MHHAPTKEKMADNIGYGGVIARFAGKACVAFGFILGTYGLTEGSETIKRTALGLLITGVLASAYGAYHWIRNRGVTSHPPTPGAVAPTRPEPAKTGSLPVGRAPSRGDQDRASRP